MIALPLEASKAASSFSSQAIYSPGSYLDFKS